MELNYFKLDEFDSPDEVGSGNKMDEDFIVKIEQARKIANIPFIITSGYRTKQHNKKIGGVNNSSHTKGKACDILCKDNITRFIIINALLSVGFNRIGIAKTFIHVDNDNTKNTNRIWLY